MATDPRHIASTAPEPTSSPDVAAAAVCEIPWIEDKKDLRSGGQPMNTDGVVACAGDSLGLTAEGGPGG